MIPHVKICRQLFQSRLLLSSTRLFNVSHSKQKPTKQSSNQLSGQEETTNREPIKFFGSGAATWRAKDTRSGGADETLWYQPYVISGSLALFLIYFCVLREENDIDQKLEGSLFDHLEGFEEQQLVINYKYNKEKGLETKDIENRLLELGINVKTLDQ